MNREIQDGAQNVFLDLGFSVEEAENLRIRSELMDQITTLIETQNWSSEQAAIQLGTSNANLDALHQGKINQFSIEQLITMLTPAGLKIRVEVLPAVA
ncbi:helix-turn-helix domain-containing protein [Alkalinema pantanalense CENA528]|uniref:helix-turn-helix domain-containing protein n=1 Tax=Alkalinema pantanalense TaxID=1620705 RepID=UPI003D6E613C